MMEYEAVIAAYNAADLIGETIQSLLNSSIPPNRIWVVDDASSDNTADVSAQYDRVSILVNSENRDSSYSRNRGIRRVETPYLITIDADDIVGKRKNEIQLKYLENHQEIDVVYGDKQGFMGGLKPENLDEILRYDDVDDVFRLILKRNTIVPSMLMYRTSYFERYGYFDEDIHISNDRELYLRTMLNGAKFSYTPNALLYYRRHEASMLATRYREGIWNNYLTLKKLFEDIKDFKNGKYSKQLGYEMRMMARNLNIYLYPLEEVFHAIELAHICGSKIELEQSSIYKLIESVIGPKSLESILRLKFKLTMS
jgi:glycosyltransferase involved in cell wall biosynthesis